LKSLEKFLRALYLDKLLGAVEDSNGAVIKVAENLSALGGSILTVEVPTLPPDVDALLLVDRVPERKGSSGATRRQL
jgi:hypothetical protein